MTPYKPYRPFEPQMPPAPRHFDLHFAFLALALLVWYAGR